MLTALSADEPKKSHKLAQNFTLSANGREVGGRTSTLSSATGIHTVNFHRYFKKNASDQASDKSRLLSSRLRKLCLAGTVAVLLSGVTYVSTDDSQSAPQKTPDVVRLQAFSQKLPLVEVPSAKEDLTSDQLTSQSLASAFGSGWKLRDHAGRYDVFRSEQYPQVLLALHVEDGTLREACVFVNRLDANKRTLAQIAGTASRLFSDAVAANELRNWLKLSWAMPEHKAAYWSGAEQSPFKAFCFSKELVTPEELAAIFQDRFEGRQDAAIQKLKVGAEQSLQVVGVYLYPSHQQPPAANGSLQEIGLDFREPFRRMACRLELTPQGSEDVDG
jgi:hypothetical protein